MTATLNNSPFADLANSIKVKGTSLVFLEGEDGILSYRVVSDRELSDQAISDIFGVLVPKLRKGLKPLGYTLDSKPEVIDGSVFFHLRQSSFHGRLADLVEGWSTSDQFIREASEILQGELDSRKLRDAIALLQAVEARGLKDLEKSRTDSDILSEDVLC